MGKQNLIPVGVSGDEYEFSIDSRFRDFDGGSSPDRVLIYQDGLGNCVALSGDELEKYEKKHLDKVFRVFHQ